ncbi:MAG: EamA family transporter RarD [Clostridia bacterium]|nr:EamA family transporter RarD [Clostridia bacterium]
MNDKNLLKGHIMAFAGYLIWGILPIYWHQLNSISAGVILVFRIILSAITLLIIVFAAKNVQFTSYFKDKFLRRRLALASLMISANWILFIYAVNNDYVLQASLGYYINPLISILLGIVFLREKLGKAKIVAISLAALGVGYMAVSLGSIPYISLALAFSFGLYGFIKKKLQLDSYNALLVETLMLSIPAAIYSLYLLLSGPFPVQNVSTLQIALILMAGVITCLPLILFNEGAKRIPLSSLGFLQYLTPTLMLLIGVFLYGEPFTKVHIVSFALIWAGYFIYIFSFIFSSKPSSENQISSE